MSKVKLTAFRAFMADYAKENSEKESKHISIRDIHHNIMDDMGRRLSGKHRDHSLEQVVQDIDLENEMLRKEITTSLFY